MQAELDSLRLQAQSQAAELAALRDSRALRLGNAVLTPARWIRSRLHR
jgi:hypothetical protein